MYAEEREAELDTECPEVTSNLVDVKSNKGYLSFFSNGTVSAKECDWEVQSVEILRDTDANQTLMNMVDGVIPLSDKTYTGSRALMIDMI